VVALEAVGEGVQVGLVVGLDGGDPVVKAVAVQASEDLGELGDVPGERVQMRAACPGLRELGLLIVVQVVRVFEDPAGEVAGFRRAGDGGRGGAGLAEREDVVADGAVSALVAALCELGVQLADVGAAFVPPLVQVGLVVVEERRASVPDLGEQLIDGGGAVEAADRLLGQAGLAHDGLDAFALGAQRLDLLIPLLCADRQGGLLRPPGRGLGCGLLQVRDGRFPAGLIRFRLGDRFCQAAAVPGNCLLHVLGEVVVEMPAIRDLLCFRGALAGAVGVGAGPVTADHPGPRVLLQPLGECACLAVAQQVHGLAGLRVDQDGPVIPAAAEREIIGSEHCHRPGLRVGQRHDQPQHAGAARRQVQPRRQPRPGPAGQGQRDHREHPRQRRGPPGAPRGQALDLLGERDGRAARVAAEEPPHRQPDQHPVAADRRVGQPPPVGAVHPARGPAAPRAYTVISARTRPYAQQAARDLGGVGDHPGQVRQQPLQADPVLA